MFDILVCMGRAGEFADELIDTIRSAASQLAQLELCDVPAQELGALLQRTEQMRSVVDAAATAVLDRFDAQGAAAYDGLRSTSSWLRQRCQMTGATAARRVRVARALRELPEVGEGFRTGRFSADQADLFARHRSPRTAEAMAQDEAVLAALADRLRPDDLARELRGWAEMVDTDGAEPDPGHRDRGFTFVQTLDDTWTGRLDLSAADGLVVHRAIEAMAERLHRRDEAGRRTGDGNAERAVDGAGPTGGATTGGTRSRTQRRADALVELVLRGSGLAPRAADDGAEAATDAGIDAGADAVATADVAPTGDTRPTAGTKSVRSPRSGPRVTLHLVLDAADLEGGRGADTLDGHHIGPTGTDQLLCDCLLARVVTDPITGLVLDLDRSRRVVSAAQWSALALRDRGCSFPGCAAPPDECQAHHIVHWRRNGLTNLDNLTLACHHHHTLVHDGGWDVTMTAMGPRWLRPDGSTVDGRPGWAIGPPGHAAPPLRSVPSTHAPRRRSAAHRRRDGTAPPGSAEPGSDPSPDDELTVLLARERARALIRAA
jgi:hypothetical protein